MDFLELASKRFSCRKYKSAPVPAECVEKILEAAKLAPTAHNNQPQKIIAVSSCDGLARINKCTDCHYNEPLAFIVCYEKSRAWVREYDGKSSGDVDAAIVTTHMMLEAENLGLGSTWIMWFDPEAAAAEFGLPNDVVPAALLFVGYADVDSSKYHRIRRNVEEYAEYR